MHTESVVFPLSPEEKEVRDELFREILADELAEATRKENERLAQEFASLRRRGFGTVQNCFKLYDRQGNEFSLAQSGEVCPFKAESVHRVEAYMADDLVLTYRQFKSEEEYLVYVYSRCTRWQMVREIWHLTQYLYGKSTVFLAPGFEDARFARLIALARLFGSIPFNDDLRRAAKEAA